MLIHLGYFLALNYAREWRLVNLFSLLFGFSGRVNRLQYWLGGMGAGVAIFVLFFVLMLMGGMTNPTLGKEQQAAHFLGMFGLVLIPAIMLASWVGYALAWKRFHDRGKSGTWVFLPMAPSFMMVSSVFGAAMSGADPVAVAGASQPWGMILFVIQIWFLVELGFMPGKEGPNKYGNPPGGGFDGSAPVAPVSGPTRAAAKAGGLSIPGMSGPAPPPPSLASAESAMEQAIAARAKAAQTLPRAPAAPTPAMAGAGGGGGSTGLRPAPGGSFGRKATR